MRKLLVAAASAASLVFATTALACESDLDCAPPTPICDIVCVECLVDQDCAAAEPRCNSATGTCGPCSSDDHCAAFPATPACTASGACGECSATNDSLCGGTQPVCDVASSSCAACSSNADCAGSPEGEVCLGSGACGSAEAVCPETPSDCLTAGASTLRFGNPGDPARKSLVWTWNYGFTALEDFGDPIFTTHFAVCLYRDGALISSAQIDPSASFWKASRGGYRFAHPVGNADGIRKLNLRFGADDARIALKGKRENLELVPMPVGGSSFAVQLVSDAANDSRCWGSSFTAPYAIDAATLFKVRQVE